MCRYLVVLAKNEFDQAAFICEHDTLHLVHQHASVIMTRKVFYQLDKLFQSRYLGTCQSSDASVRCVQTDSGDVELWIGKGGFRLKPFELIALASLVQSVAERLRIVPLRELLQRSSSYQQATSEKKYSLN